VHERNAQVIDPDQYLSGTRHEIPTKSQTAPGSPNGNTSAQAVGSRFANAAGQARDAISNRADNAAAMAGEAADFVQDTTLSIRDAVQDAIERQPFTAVVVAAGLGLFAGFLFARR